VKQLLTGGRVFDGTGRPVIDDGAVLVDGSRIEAVGRASDFSADMPGVEVVPCGGGTLLPGLINAHVHLGLDGDAESYVTKLPTMARAVDATITLIAAQQAYKSLLNGVTTVRDLHPPSGGTQQAILALRDAIDAGVVPGARVVASGQAICMLGGHGVHWRSREVSGVEDARRAVRELTYARVDVIKLMAGTPWGPLPGRPATYARQLTVDEMAAVVDTAHRAGVPVTAHARGEESVADALQAGVDGLEHGSGLTEALAEQMVRRQTYLVPTLSPLCLLIEAGVGPQVPEAEVRAAEFALGRDRASVANALAAGVKIALGTDAGAQLCPHGEMVSELDQYVSVGMTPCQALVAATRTGAEVLRLDSEIGTLEPGKRADLLVVQGRPDESVAALRALKLVMKDGVVYRDELRQRAAVAR
jgi:imidazolonepropionase-like amidohydrolase